MEAQKPIVVAVHPNLVNEFKIRKEQIESETGRKTKGGITNFSEMAAYELKILRMSGDEIMEGILKIKNPPIHRIIVEGMELEFVPYELFKKLFIYSSALNKKKDQKQLHLEVTRVKGTHKNEIKYF
jgi:hypothetical protein